MTGFPSAYYGDNDRNVSNGDTQLIQMMLPAVSSFGLGLTYADREWQDWQLLDT